MKLRIWVTKPGYMYALANLYQYPQFISKHCENVAVISSNNGLLYLMCTGSQRYAWSRHLFYIALEAGIYCENKGSIEKTRDL